MKDYVRNEEKFQKLQMTKISLREISIPFVREGGHTPLRSVREWLRGRKMEIQERLWNMSGAA